MVDEEFVLLSNRDIRVVDGVVGDDGEGVSCELAPRKGQLAILSAEHGDRLSATNLVLLLWGRTKQGGISGSMMDAQRREGDG